MNRYLLTILIIIVAGQVFAQNDSYSTLNMFNYMYYNPGYAGDGNEIEAKAHIRNQWMNFPNAPNTQTFSIDAPFNLFRQKHGVGLSVVNDEIGFFQNISLNLSYAYRKKLMQGELGIGAGLNMINSGYQGNWISPDGNPSGDVAIISGAYKPLGFDLNLGVFYSTDNLYLSVSGKNLAGGTKLEYKNESTGSGAIYNYGSQFFVSTGYNYQLKNPLFSIQPALFLASDFASTQWSLSGLLTYNQRFFGGVAYKSVDAVSAILGIDLPAGITASASYDFPTSRVGTSSIGSFEFMVGYSFSLDMSRDNNKYKSVRFL